MATDDELCSRGARDDLVATHHDVGDEFGAWHEWVNMDPATIIGTTGAIVGIVDVVTKTIMTLRDLRDRWKTIALTVSNLITQLNSLKAALNKISEWISSDLSNSPQHHQLIIDLEEAIHCCRLLVKSMDENMEQLNQNGTETLDFQDKLKVFFNNSDFETFQTFIQRQISALNLLLTACNWYFKLISFVSPRQSNLLNVCSKTLHEQRTRLEDPGTREAFDRVRDDSSSLIVLHDSASFFSKATVSTENSARFSAIFPFDSELISTQVYQRAVRRLFKAKPRGPVMPTTESTSLSALNIRATLRQRKETKEAAERSAIIEKSIEKDTRIKMREIPLLLTGGNGNSYRIILGKLQYHFEGIERATQIEMLTMAITRFQELYRNLGKTVDDYSETVHSALKPPGTGLEDLRQQANAVHWLWQDSISEESHTASTMLDNIMRLAEPSYTPTYADIGNMQAMKSSYESQVQETSITLGQLVLRIVACSSRLRSRVSLLQAGDFRVLCFVVDLDTYNAESFSDDRIPTIDDFDEEWMTQPEIVRSLAIFKDTMGPRGDQYKYVILLFDNITIFKHKLMSVPLASAFPDYTGVSFCDKAQDFLIEQFKKVCAEDVQTTVEKVAGKRTASTLLGAQANEGYFEE
ncbi:uncharacterized protein KY384_000339 [Bacidia gigantensis]|uniref:uncharacterized protein n=1 Tax=Bacidia gigantensis TaxID=2732470 RepID=UPI001D037072|nr:uncharacterized protein KY384_000339 [Bacidia gigantensis]KAG8526346.1 hypothetical protein KY384_000339 [Bacidia gigantensis]